MYFHEICFEAREELINFGRLRLKRVSVRVMDNPVGD